MSNIERIFPFERSEFSKYGYLFLLAIISISSLMDRGAFSSSYHHDPFIVIIPLVLSSYLLTIWCMRLTGLNPNKFEMVFIPLIILSTIFFILTFMDSLPKIDEGDTTATTEESGLSKSSAPSVSAFSSTQIGTTQNTFLPAVDNGLNSQVRNFLGIIFPIFIILVVVVLLLIYINRGEGFLPGIQIGKEIAYTQPVDQFQKDIITLYIEASHLIENFKGKAPKWFSPTKFSHTVEFNPGPPISNYFDRLTTLYEWARFSSKKLTSDDVLEAQELNLQIKSWIEKVMPILLKPRSI
ncbi:MAG: hypothetical protein ACW98K_01065 [Candidatus Kariarchaeaceae archaeon]